MTTCALDTLIVALRDAVASADAAIGRRRQALLDPAGDDALVSHALHVNVPATPAPDAPLEPVTLPLRLFRDARLPRIALMSVEFDCWFRVTRPWGKTRSDVLLVLGKPRFAWLTRRKTHHVRLSFLSRDAWRPNVEVDGRDFPVPSHEDTAGVPT